MCVRVLGHRCKDLETNNENLNLKPMTLLYFRMQKTVFKTMFVSGYTWVMDDRLTRRSLVFHHRGKIKQDKTQIKPRYTFIVEDWITETAAVDILCFHSAVSPLSPSNEGYMEKIKRWNAAAPHHISVCVFLFVCSHAYISHCHTSEISLHFFDSEVTAWLDPVHDVT